MTLSSAQVAALKSGLQQFVAWAGSVGGQLPVGDGTAGAILQDVLQRGLVQLGNLGGADKGVLGTVGVSVPLTAGLNFDFSFGLSGSTFYVKLPGGIGLRTRIDASGITLPVSVGLLSARARGGSVEMNAQTTLAVRDANNDGLLTLNELTAAGTTLSRGGSLFVELPYEAQLGALSEDGVISISHTNLGDGQQANTVDLAGAAGEVRQVSRLTPSAVLQYLRNLAGLLEKADASAQLAATLPFTQGLMLGEVADLAAAFRTQVLDRVATADGQPKFHTAQELTDLLASTATGAIGLGLDYDAAHQELVFSLNFKRSVDRSAALDLGVNVPHLADLHLDNPQVQVQAVVSGGLVFGINLGEVANESQLTTATPLSQINGNSPVPFNNGGGDHTDLEVRLTDGTTFVVDFQNEQTIADVVRTIQTASGGRVHVTVGADNNLLLQEDAGVALGVSTFRVRALNSSEAGSILGILGESSTRDLAGAG